MRTRTREMTYHVRRRHRRWRAISLLVVLAAAAGTVWITVLGQATDTNARVRCPTPAGTTANTDNTWRPLPYTDRKSVV